MALLGRTEIPEEAVFGRRSVISIYLKTTAGFPNSLLCSGTLYEYGTQTFDAIIDTYHVKTEDYFYVMVRSPASRILHPA
jgi:hypothetical protein